MLLNSAEIRELASQGMIEPFVPEKVRKTNELSVISYGLSGYGYDLRLSPDDFRIFKNPSSLRRLLAWLKFWPLPKIDPKNFNCESLEAAKLHRDETGEYFLLPGHSYGLGVAMDKLDIPGNITCLFIGKSTYARSGIIANLTPGEARWRGYLTLEVSNSSPADAKIYANEGIVQALFLEGRSGGNPYGAGKYQDQKAEVTLARI